MTQSRIGILGGGISGLTSAYYLARAGFKPVVLEPSADLGGFVAQVDHQGLLFDREPDALLNTDTAVCGLLAELRALGRVTWRPVRNAVMMSGRIHPLSSPAVALRMNGVTLPQRLRFGAGLLYVTRLQGYTLHLNRVRAVEWLPRVFGHNAFEQVWRPYLDLHYGEWADEIPAYPLWREMNQLHDLRRSVGGYLRGGPRWLGERLRRSIEEAGGEVHLHSRIESIDANARECMVEVDGRMQHFDALISTLTPSALAKAARGPVARLAAKCALPQRARVTAMLISKQGVSAHHRTIVADDSAPFHVLEEATRVVPARQCGGKHLIYATNTCDSNGDAFKVPDDVVRKQVVESMIQCYPGFDSASVEAVHVTRVAEAEPVFTVDNVADRPGFRANGVPLYLCTQAQAYPRPRGWDAEITLAREVAGVIRTQHG